MELAFIYQAVDDMDAALTFYRDTLGLAESWREGDTTVAFELPGSPLQLMVDLPPEAQPRWRSGLFFKVDDVAAFMADNASLTWLGEATEIPDGREAAFADPAGNTIHIFDQSGATD